MDYKNRILPPKLKDVKENLISGRKQSKEKKPYEIKIVTPMFGGGNEPGELDETFPVRSSSIRGHLRFWWRATRGAAFQDVKELRRHEVAIFGDTHSPSRVKIWVESRHKPEITDAREIDKNKQVRPGKEPAYRFKNFLPLYAVFPYTSNNKVRTLRKLTFTLYVQYSDYIPTAKDKVQDNLFPDIEALKKEVEAALWAWINFGGIGNRTRRGCGSLFSESFSPKLGEKYASYTDWYEKKQLEYGLKLLSCEEIGGLGQGWPTLPKEIHIQTYDRDLTLAWKKVIEIYKNFRAFKAGYKRSMWPEADSLRLITGMAEGRHKDPLPEDKGKCIAFPRAEMGLPIIFEFKQDFKLKGMFSDKREPYKTQLIPKGKNRLASPLITKALAISECRGVGVIVRLNHPKLDKLELQMVPEKMGRLSKHEEEIKKCHERKVKDRIKQYDITQKDIYKELTYSDSPVNMGNKEKPFTSAIDAFLNGKEVEKWKIHRESEKKPYMGNRNGQNKSYNGRNNYNNRRNT
ncbi:type III-B CRISPR module RAMP protein Cmr1 [Paenibacillus ottowii]|uniref:type III-B CRISPR module RAMP protein Cmr1 n=1 Tax=Paenibacillus ottowii TaxID=2315729 RepID=UPI0027311661|nr:type III-B CRISPR module RAMP protein Cmr1 [Paenibacillus ottowii]MDP1509168.1 type III-B CRISPR module RAMP protein Cmr1 [Paenibacillus ottowii]